MKPIIKAILSFISFLISGFWVAYLLTFVIEETSVNIAISWFMVSFLSLVYYSQKHSQHSHNLHLDEKEKKDE